MSCEAHWFVLGQARQKGGTALSHAIVVVEPPPPGRTPPPIKPMVLGGWRLCAELACLLQQNIGKTPHVGFWGFFVLFFVSSFFKTNIFTSASLSRSISCSSSQAASRMSLCSSHTMNPSKLPKQEQISRFFETTKKRTCWNTTRKGKRSWCPEICHICCVCDDTFT